MLSSRSFTLESEIWKRVNNEETLALTHLLWIGFLRILYPLLELRLHLLASLCNLLLDRRKHIVRCCLVTLRPLHRKHLRQQNAHSL